MRKIISIIAAMAVSLSICACESTGSMVTIDTEGTADILVNELVFSEELTKISSSVQMKRYGLDETTVTEAAGYAGTRAVVDEVAVFKCTDTEAVAEAARAHIDSQIKNYTSYAPNEVPKLNDAVIEIIGDCVVVCVSASDVGDVKAIIGTLAE